MSKAGQAEAARMTLSDLQERRQQADDPAARTDIESQIAYQSERVGKLSGEAKLEAARKVIEEKERKLWAGHEREFKAKLKEASAYLEAGGIDPNRSVSEIVEDMEKRLAEQPRENDRDAGAEGRDAPAQEREPGSKVDAREANVRELRDGETVTGEVLGRSKVKGRDVYTLGIENERGKPERVNVPAAGNFRRGETITATNKGATLTVEQGRGHGL